MNRNRAGMNKFIKGFLYALSGLVDTFKTELNFRFHTLCILLAAALGIYVSLRPWEWLWVGLAIALVLSTELLNTAIESLSNLVSPDYQPLIKKAKDASAAAVLIAALFALMVAFVVFLPKVWSLFS